MINVFVCHNQSLIAANVFQTPFFLSVLYKRNISQTNIKTNSFSLKEKDYPSLNPNNIQNKPDSTNQRQFSYADAAKNSDTSTVSNNSIMERIEVMLNKQLELTNSLLHMMTIIITKLCN